MSTLGAQTPLRPADLFPESLSDADGDVLSVRDLSVKFGGIHALDGFSLTVRHGELVAVVGPNGAGKTTLLNALCGVVRSNMKGHVDFQGRPISGLNPAAVAAQGIGRSFQHPPLIERETVLENVLTGLHLKAPYGWAAQVFTPRRVARIEQAMQERALALLDFFGLSEIAREPVSKLPYGPRKVIDIARAIISAPRLLLLDEPTSGLDTTEQETVAELLIHLRDSGRVTMLVVEHHMDIVRAVATKAVGMEAGRVLAEGRPEEVLDSVEYHGSITGEGDR